MVEYLGSGWEFMWVLLFLWFRWLWWFGKWVKWVRAQEERRSGILSWDQFLSKRLPSSDSELSEWALWLYKHDHWKNKMRVSWYFNIIVDFQNKYCKLWKSHLCHGMTVSIEVEVISVSVDHLSVIQIHALIIVRRWRRGWVPWSGMGAPVVAFLPPILLTTALGQVGVGSGRAKVSLPLLRPIPVKVPSVFRFRTIWVSIVAL